MAFTAYGISYPRIELWATTGGTPAARQSITFAISDLCYIDAMQVVKELECPVITLEDDTRREFVRGYRLSWDFVVQTPTSNTVAQFIFRYMIPWLAGDAIGYTSGDGYSAWAIRLYPHYDETTEYFTVRIIGDVASEYWNRQWILGLKIRMTFETIDIESTVPFYPFSG